MNGSCNNGAKRYCQFYDFRNFYKKRDCKCKIAFRHNFECDNPLQNGITYNKNRTRFPQNKWFSLNPGAFDSMEEQCEGYCRKTHHFSKPINAKMKCYPSRVMHETFDFGDSNTKRETRSPKIIEKEIKPKPSRQISPVASIVVSPALSPAKVPPKLPPKPPQQQLHKSPVHTHKLNIDQTSRAIKGEGIEVTCPRCGHGGKTDVQYKIGCMNITSAIILSLLCCIPCAFLALMCNRGKDVMHICHNCKYILGIVKKRPCSNALVWNWETEKVALPERYRKSLLTTQTLATDVRHSKPYGQISPNRKSDGQKISTQKLDGQESPRKSDGHKPPIRKSIRRPSLYLNSVHATPELMTSLKILEHRQRFIL